MIALPKSARRSRLAAAATLAASGLLLGACELRRDAAPEPEAERTGTTPEAPATDAADIPGGASIIREDIAETPATPEPPEPLSVTLPFADGTDISDDAEELLELVLQGEAIRQGWPITLGGHTDSGGTDQANLRASRMRAENVAAWLIDRGIADERITVIAFGEQNPQAPNAKPDGSPDEIARRRNRRVEIRIAPSVVAPERSDEGSVASTPESGRAQGGAANGP